MASNNRRKLSGRISDDDGGFLDNVRKAAYCMRLVAACGRTRHTLTPMRRQKLQQPATTEHEACLNVAGTLSRDPLLLGLLARTISVLFVLRKPTASGSASVS
jgi:hypothetical protein